MSRPEPYRTVRARWQPGPALAFAIHLTAAVIGTALGTLAAIWALALYFGVILL